MLDIRSLTKSYAGTQALESLSLEVASGEVLAVVGENGAGKSTLGKILAGQVSPDSGTMTLNSRPLHFSSPREAIAEGIWLVNQELSTCQGLDIAANLFLGREPRRYGFIIDRARIVQDARAICQQVKLSASPLTNVDLLTIGDLQKVEIGKVLLRKPLRLVILDEASSSLAYDDFELLVSLVQELKRSGVAIIYITHRFSELARVADRIAILRDGRLVALGQIGDMEPGDVLESMSGRRIQAKRRNDRSQDKSVALSVQNLRTSAFPNAELTFDLHAGEIIGLRGAADSGAEALLRALFGIERPNAGGISVYGRELRLGSIRDAVANGVAFVPEDRGRLGLLLDLSVGDNLLLPWLSTQKSFRFDFRAELDHVKRLLDQVGIVPPEANNRASTLSGGNQQKLVVAKWLGVQPKILLLDNPTRGVDILTRAELHDVFTTLADDGYALLFRSTDDTELQLLSDRILTMKSGWVEHDVVTRPECG